MGPRRPKSAEGRVTPGCPAFVRPVLVGRLGAGHPTRGATNDLRLFRRARKRGVIGANPVFPYMSVKVPHLMNNPIFRLSPWLTTYPTHRVVSRTFCRGALFHPPRFIYAIEIESKPPRRNFRPSPGKARQGKENMTPRNRHLSEGW